MSSSQKQITEIKVEGMIAGYSSSCCIISKKTLKLALQPFNLNWCNEQVTFFHKEA